MQKLQVIFVSFSVSVKKLCWSMDWRTLTDAKDSDMVKGNGASKLKGIYYAYIKY